MNDFWSSLSALNFDDPASLLSLIAKYSAIAFVFSGMFNIFRRRNVVRSTLREHRGWKRIAALPRLISMPILHNFVGSSLLGIACAAWLIGRGAMGVQATQGDAIFDQEYFSTLITVLTFTGSAALAISANLWIQSMTNKDRVCLNLGTELKKIEDLSPSLCPKYFPVSALYGATEKLQNVSSEDITKLQYNYDYLMSDLVDLLHQVFDNNSEIAAEDAHFQAFSNRVLSIENLIKNSIYSIINGAVVVGVWGLITARLFGLVLVCVLAFAASNIWQTQLATSITDGVFVLATVWTVAAVVDFTASLNRELMEAR